MKMLMSRERMKEKISQDIENEECTVGSGNVFEDLNLDNPDELLLKSHLVVILNRYQKN